MRHVAPAILLAGSLALAGCVTSNGTGPAPSPAPDPLSQFIQEAGAAAVQVCGVEPVIMTAVSLVGGIANVFVPGVGTLTGTVQVIADKLCSLTTKVSARKGGAHFNYIVRDRAKFGAYRAAHRGH